MKHVRIVPGSVMAVLALSASVPANCLLFADANVDAVVQAHRDRQTELTEAQNTILAAADAERRELTVEEGNELDNLAAEFDRLNNEIDRRVRASAQSQILTQPQGRQTAPDEGGDDEPAPQAGGQQRPQAAAPGARPLATVPARAARPNGNGGFRSFGDFASSVRNANPRFGGQLDRRLQNAAAATYANEGSGQDGGFLVPVDFRNEILARVFGEDSLIERTRRMQSQSNSITMPVDVTTPWGGTGVQSYWTAEGATKQQSKPVFENITVKAHTLATLVPVTEELLEDAPALDGYLRMAVPREMDFKISNAVIRGSGSGQPLGIFNTDALVTVAAESGQAADTIVAANVLKMMARLPANSQRTAVWVIHPDAFPQLGVMTIGNQPAFLPAGGLSASPYATLMGRPIIFHQVAETIGDLGDISLIDFNEYISLTKTGGGRDANGLRTDVSIHLWFDQDLVAFRFTIRIGGQPIWSSAIAQRDGANKQSPYVTLAAR